MPDDPKLVVRPAVGAESAEAERALILKYLRRQVVAYYDVGENDRAFALSWHADAIENGDHLPVRLVTP